MFHMTPTSSWMTLFIVLLFVAAIVWLVRQFRARAQWDRTERAAQARRAAMAVAPLPADVPDASAESADAATARYLALAPELPSTPKPGLYDWQAQGD